MKISIDYEDLFILSETQKKVIRNDIHDEIFESDMKRRLEYIVNHPVERFLDKNSKQAYDFLKSKKIKEVPLNKMELADLVFEHAPVELSDSEKGECCIYVDGIECFKFNETKKRLLKSCVARNCDCLEWMKEKLSWILQHKYERCYERLRREWEPKLAERGLKSIPIDEEDFAELVFSQPDYKNRSQREKESSQT